MDPRRFDRRWIFLAIGIATIVFLLTDIRLDFPKIPREVHDFYNAIDQLGPGDRIFLAADYDPASEPEIRPMHELVLWHLFHRDVGVISASLWPAGPDLAEKIFANVSAAYREETGKVKEYGRDFTNLGYKDGREVVMTSMATKLRETFPVDKKKTPIEEIPLLEGVEGFVRDPDTGERSVALVVNVASGYPGTREWLRQVQRRYDVRFLSGVTSVMAPDLFPFLQSRQLEGLLGGIPGAAQYQQLLEENGILPRDLDTSVHLLYQDTPANMTTISAVHVIIIAFIILGNVFHILERRRRAS